MAFFIKYQWLFMLTAIIAGITLGQSENIADNASYLITPFLMIMLFGVFLQVPFKNLRKGFMNLKVTLLSLAVNFIWTPLLAFGLSYLFFRNTPDVYLALLMDLVTPCTDWYLVYTGIAGGNLAFSTALLPWNLLLQLLLLPLYLYLFAGAIVDIQPIIFLASFLRVLVGPFIAALIVRNIAIHIKGAPWFYEETPEYIDFLQALFLILAVTAMFASQGMVFMQNISLVIRILIPVAIFFSVNFLLGRLIGKLFKLSYSDNVSLIITILARNAPLAIVIAIAVFPERTLIPLVLAVESLIELPLLYLFAQILLYMRQNGKLR